ncbi:TetR/AcrR family transcriptional regulator [Xenorhabdus cabanillasii]|uniref:TetR family transcriptional regulator n=2 Tax=Xenorhabdus cabanillasii TaxID=351673 RepID=A0A3D9UE91_9GAMM|nr:TetR/AcrR family transcriptional regulator [Xenorhabdus cabanillasii]PHM76538.1 ica operon transcription regulator [Xenorhabdus cabanillasii JM26]REF26220.1 TetR family transcriptional regulator [Xenorhabdus cabanillasii]CDL86829.1 putative transcriptional regulator, TetR family [Xenorhabdus cabanillasii JM26]
MAENHPRPRGRPSIPEQEIREKIHDITLSLLLNQGYSATTMDVIAQQAKIAKKTLYRFVKNREDLIEQVILNWTDNAVLPLTKNANNYQQVIISLGNYLMGIAEKSLSKDAVGLFKLLQSDFPHRDAFLEKYQQGGLEKNKIILANWLEQQYKQGLLKEFNYKIFSELAISMVIAEPLRQMVLGQTPPLPETDISHRITAIINLLKSGLPEK